MKRDDMEKVDLEGDPAYLPDELLQSNGFVGPPADIFSLGATLFEMAADIEMPTGGPLWHDLRENRIPMESMRHHNRSEELQAVISQMMARDANSRPTAAALCERYGERRARHGGEQQRRLAKGWVCCG